MSVQSRNAELVENAWRTVVRIAVALAEVDIEPRFDIAYEGFGTGGMSNVTPEYACRFLRDMASDQDPHARYSTPIRSITIKLRIPDITLSA